MLDHKTLWRLLVAQKQAQSYHVLQNIILKALARSKGDVRRARRYVMNDVCKAFTPITRKIKLDNGQEPWGAIPRAAFAALWAKDVLGAPRAALGDLESTYVELLGWLRRGAVKEYVDRRYVYIFVRQDLSREQQLVQAAHVALKCGYHLACSHITQMDDLGAQKEKPDNLYFTVVGVTNEGHLEQVSNELRELNHKHWIFKEPDIGNQSTAIATEPIPARERGDLLRHSLLVMN